jgi:hypothetical protein
VSGFQADAGAGLSNTFPKTETRYDLFDQMEDENKQDESRPGIPDPDPHRANRPFRPHRIQLTHLDYKEKE